jgi:toxin-antitoxin system PIN domain toxin
MKLVDLNLLLYAINRDAAQHRAARRWLEATLSGDEPVALPWIVLIGFLRVATHRRILPKPLTAEQALSVVDGWLQQPAVRPLQAGPQHWPILRELLSETGTAGNLSTDAHLAALAIENGSQLCSADTDFGRYPRLRWINPL